jgi:hypothetical protein
MEVSIIKTVYSKFDYKYNELIQNIINHLNFNNYSGKGILTRKTYPIHLLEQVGGVKKEIKLKDGYTYEYHIDEIIPIDSKNNRLCFVNIDESQDYCACLLYNTKKSGKTVLIIRGILNGEDCIKCIDKKHKYKVGNILMQVILEVVKSSKEFEHITEIQLQDTSMKKCYGIGIKLKYLRTITHGEPYYAKYGFRPYEKKAYEIYRYNRKLHKENVMLDNKVVDKIFENTKDMNNKKPYLHYVNKYKKHVLKTNPIDIKLLINKIISKGDCEDIDTETRKIGCELLSYAIVHLYNALGYKEYIDKDGSSLSDIWTLKIR